MKVYYIWRDKKEIKMKRSRKRKKNKTLSRSKKGLIILIIITVLLCVVTILKKQEQSKEYTENKSDYIDSVKPDIDVELLTPNEYSRPGIATNKITGIVVHYTANYESKQQLCCRTGRRDCSVCTDVGDSICFKQQEY